MKHEMADGGVTRQALCGRVVELETAEAERVAPRRPS